MYSEEELELIVGHFRKQLVPAPVQDVSDIKVCPNDILMSYLISGMGPARAALSGLMGDAALLERALFSSIPDGSDSEALPQLPFFMSYLEGPVYVSRALREVTGSFAAAHGSAMILADAEPRRYEYPSGFSVDYACLVNEKTANMSIFDMAVALPETGNIYLRENSAATMLAYLDVMRERPSARLVIPDSFEDDLRGISIAHELCEMRILESGRAVGDIELEAERSAQHFLVENGVPLASYLLFHQLRAGRHEDIKGKDYSLFITEGF